MAAAAIPSDQSWKISTQVNHPQVYDAAIRLLNTFEEVQNTVQLQEQEEEANSEKKNVHDLESRQPPVFFSRQQEHEYENALVVAEGLKIREEEEKKTNSLQTTFLEVEAFFITTNAVGNHDGVPLVSVLQKPQKRKPVCGDNKHPPKKQKRLGKEEEEEEAEAEEGEGKEQQPQEVVVLWQPKSPYILMS
ncbi:unnamed protein product [Rotaria magnacalcarata]|uniref:Uncharacterized protein n=1 Tax=Rotaria magnacalcarata TaxID=392030 RepID=A0A814ZYP8_9BILA|nr:unnamed protein product [Rotaria magnacalcarata]CAF3818340.1 unnamed protein product [Rotaria magnacalcarata]